MQTHRRAFKYFYCEVSDMKKAASVFLRGDICRRDLELMALWLEKPQITRYLNEHASVVYDLTRLADTVPEPMLGYHLNRQGRFFIICCAEGDAIGFVKLARTAIPGEYEIVYAIGEDSLWGFGYGKAAIHKALSLAFSQPEVRSVVAKIDPCNVRSRRLASACGFQEVGQEGSLLLFRAKALDRSRTSSFLSIQ